MSRSHDPEYDYWYWYDIRMYLLDTQGRCRYCRKPLDKYTVTIDHFMPKSKGGTDDLGNLVAACDDCNNRKGDMLPKAFLALLPAQA